REAEEQVGAGLRRRGRDAGGLRRAEALAGRRHDRRRRLALGLALALLLAAALRRRLGRPGGGAGDLGGGAEPVLRAARRDRPVPGAAAAAGRAAASTAAALGRGRVAARVVQRDLVDHAGGTALLGITGLGEGGRRNRGAGQQYGEPDCVQTESHAPQ